MLFPVDLIKECNVQPSATKVIHVRGESMFPKLKDGQAISIDMSAKTIYDGEIYAFQVGDDTKIKYLFNWNDEGKGGFKLSQQTLIKINFLTSTTPLAE